MGKARSLIFGGVVGALGGVVLAPRRGESRQVALDRLRLAVRPGRGALGAFAGTPCAAAGPAAAAEGPERADAVRSARGEGDQDA